MQLPLRAIFSVTLALWTAGCSAEVEVPGEPDAPESEPKTCQLPVRLRLEPKSGGEACEPIECDIWAGHGRHLSCPADEWTNPTFAGCSVWDCECEQPGDRGGKFVADFSTGEVVDTRGHQSQCTYTIVPME